MMSSNGDQDDNTRTYFQLTNGTIIGHYCIIQKIGSGGMGEVYLAEDTELNRKVALKFLPPHLCQDSDCRARFKREAQAAAKLNHPNIVTIHEVSEFNGRPFIAMERVEGRSLRVLRKDKELSLSYIIDIAIQICEGLAKAHAAGIIHRDIKPSNILIDPEGRAKIVDFGLAAVKGAEHLTRTGSTLGTPGYISPEQVRGEPVDTRSDLFSLGIVLYELITGKAPFAGESDAATLKNVLDKDPEPLARYKRCVPDELQRIVDNLLEKKPELRYQTAADLASDLRRLSITAPLAGRRNRVRWNVGASIAALIIVAIVAGYFLRQRPMSQSARIMLAVLPFKNLSPDPDQEYFSDGLTDELTSKLSLVQSICVISLSSSMTFKGSDKTIPEIAKALKVRYVVEGSVRRAGDELRIIAKLIDARADASLWSRTYRGTIDDIFDIQDSVSQAIVGGIRIQLTPEETRRLGKRPFNNVIAYEYYLRGKDEIRKGTEEAINRGLQYIRQAIDTVGDNALLYSGMAYGYHVLVNAGFAQDEYLAKAEEYAEKALDLDPELPEAYVRLGWIDAAVLGNVSEAVKHYKTALVYDPNNRMALGMLAACYCEWMGKVSEAKPLLQRRFVADPLDSIGPHFWNVYVQFLVGDFSQALEGFRWMYNAGQIDIVIEVFYVLELAHCDSIDEAFTVIDTCVKANPTSSLAHLLQVIRFALLKNREEVFLAMTPDLQKTCRRDGVWSYYLGSLLALSGAKTEAYDWLENAVNRGYINYPFMEKDRFLDSLRGEERFKKLMERVKYEWEHFEL